MMPKAKTALVGLACLLWMPLAGGCEKTKADQGEDILTQLIEMQESTIEDLFDTVEDNSDICNKCLREVRALVDRNEGQMRGLAAQWEQLKANTPIKDQREAVNRVTPMVGETFNRLRSQQDAQFKVFEEFRGHCPQQMPDVYDTFTRATTLFNSIIGYEFM